MKPLRYMILISLLTALLYGCGGGSHNNTQTTRKGRATFVVHWPARTTRLIPIASNSISVTVYRNGTQIATQLLPRPQQGNTSQATFDPLPVDSLTVNAIAFPNPDGTGVAQAQGSATLNVQPDVNTTINLTMGTTITQVVVAPQNPLLVYGNPPGNMVTLTASAMDAQNNIVLTSGNTFTWTTSNANVASVKPNGSMVLVTATGVGAVQITVNETESNVVGQTQVKIRGNAILAGTWAKFRANLQNTGVGQGTLLGRNLDWCTATGGPIDSSPAIALDGTIYVGSGDGNIYAFRKIDGSILWTSFLGGHIRSSPVLGADGTIYVASTNGQVVALEKSDGSQKWNQFLFGASFTSSPTLGPDGTLYIGGEDGVIRAFDGATGDPKWTSPTGGAIESSPALSADGAVLFIGSGDKQVHAVQTADGSGLWTAAAGGAVQSTPALNSTTRILYFGADDGKVYAVNSADGSPAWNAPFLTGGVISASPALGILNGSATLIVASNDAKLYALDPATGSALVAPFQTGGSIRSSPAISSDGTVVFGSDDLKIYGVSLSISGFVQQFTFSTGGGVGSSPAINNGSTLYVGSTDNKLYSLTGGG